MCRKYAQEVVQEAARKLHSLNYTAALPISIRRGIAFEYAYGEVSRKLSREQRNEILDLGLTHGILSKQEVESENTSIDNLIQAVLRHCTSSRPRIAI